MSTGDVVIVHELPGRLRLRLGRPPRNIEDMVASVRRHEGIGHVVFSPVTRSLLVRYNPALVNAVEILVRVAIFLSLHFENASVSISHALPSHNLRAIDYYAGSSLVVAALGRAAAGPWAKVLEYHAGAATVVSVFNHAWQEVADEGVYHPEVISVMYLINSMLRGNMLTATAITWAATFGRHLLEATDEHCRLQAAAVDDDGSEAYIDVMVKPMRPPQANPLKLVVAAMGSFIGLEQPGGENNIMRRIANMSANHGNVLEGMGRTPQRVYMRLNQ